SNPVAYKCLGDALEAQHRLDSAILAYQKALQLRHPYPEASSGLARTQLQQQVQALTKNRQPLRVIIGAGQTQQPGWIASDIQLLDVLRAEDWSRYFKPGSLDAILAEHIWEHLSLEAGILAARHCYEFLKVGGYVRVAVPDGYHPRPDYIQQVKPGGTGLGAEDHQVLYTYESLQKGFEQAGFKVELLEYFDKTGQFHCKDWHPETGLISRSKRFDPRNQTGASTLALNYTSIILDAHKVVWVESTKPNARIFSNINCHSPTGENSENPPQSVQNPERSQGQENLVQTIPPNQTSNYLEASGWLQSQRVQQPVNQGSNPIPWYTYPAIEFIEALLRPEFRVFEYGSGNSTLWYAQRATAVFTVENDPKWFDKIQSATQNLRQVQLFLLEDPERYTNKIQDYPNAYFDLIVIDGRHRNQCARRCSEQLRPSGVIVFDNTDRAKYNPGIRFLGKQGFKRIDFYGLIPCYSYKTCTSVFFKDDSVLKRLPLPSQKQSCLGLTLGQIEALNGLNRE
ncbi:MAG: class I SAM-dependent methyltransferase, partial [Microcoleaceae cyanobacterium]